jgi:mono/diheme cytochrome c family protein
MTGRGNPSGFFTHPLQKSSNQPEVHLNTVMRLTFVVLLLPLAAPAQDSNPAASLTANPVYQQNCAKCHGKTAEGRHFAGPSLVSEKTTSMSQDDLRTVIANGRHHMPKFAGKLTSDEIDTLASQMKAQKK